MTIPSGAIINFPTSVDIYSTKVDQGTSVTETHTVPSLPPYQFYLYHVPLFNGGIPNSTVNVNYTYTEVTGIPAPLQFSVVYSGNNAGLITLNSSQAGASVPAIYTANGDEVVAEWFNSITTSITGIETYILGNVANSG